MNDKPYLGTGWGFPISFLKNEGVVMVCEDKDIEQSLRILLSTMFGERLFRFDYGSNIHQWVFSKMNLSEKTMIIDSIEKAILDGEPRIEVESIDVEIKDTKESILWISINYRVRQTNSRSNMVFPFYLREGTNLDL